MKSHHHLLWMRQLLFIILFILALFPSLLTKASTLFTFHSQGFISKTKSQFYNWKSKFKKDHLWKIRGGYSAENDYYDVLGIDRNASELEIKKAYRAKAMQQHPDKGGDAEQFKVLGEAYEVLSNAEKKKMYDRYGKVDANQMNDDSGMRGGFTSSDFGDLFRGFGRGFGGFSIPVLCEVEVSLEDMFKGKDMNIPISGKTVKLKIERGMVGGVEMIVRGLAGGGTRDIIFRIKEAPHTQYLRQNSDLLVDVPITLGEALFGFQKSILFLDNTIIQFQSPVSEIVGNDAVYCLEGFGMPVFRNPEKRGRLFIRTKLRMPTQLSSDHAVCQRLREAYSAATGEKLSADGTSSGSSGSSNGREVTNKSKDKSSSSSGGDGTNENNDDSKSSSSQQRNLFKRRQKSRKYANTTTATNNTSPNPDIYSQTASKDKSTDINGNTSTESTKETSDSSSNISSASASASSSSSSSASDSDINKDKATEQKTTDKTKSTAQSTSKSKSPFLTLKPADLRIFGTSNSCDSDDDDEDEATAFQRFFFR